MYLVPTGKVLLSTKLNVCCFICTFWPAGYHHSFGNLTFVGSNCSWLLPYSTMADTSISLICFVSEWMNGCMNGWLYYLMNISNFIDMTDWRHNHRLIEKNKIREKFFSVILSEYQCKICFLTITLQHSYSTHTPI